MLLNEGLRPRYRFAERALSEGERVDYSGLAEELKTAAQGIISATQSIDQYLAGRNKGNSWIKGRKLFFNIAEGDGVGGRRTIVRVCDLSRRDIFLDTLDIPSRAVALQKWDFAELARYDPGQLRVLVKGMENSKPLTSTQAARLLGGRFNHFYS